MKIHFWARTICFASIALLLGACETVTNIGFPPHEPQLAVNGLFHAGGGWSVGLRHTVPITERLELTDFESDLTAVEISVYRGATLYTRLHPCGEAIYCAEKSPQPGATYALQATAEGFNTVTATAHVPEKVPFTIQQIVDDTPEKITLRVTIDDPPGPNYYLFYVTESQKFILPDTIRWSEPRPPLRFVTSDPFLIRNNPDHGLLYQTTPWFNEITFKDGERDNQRIVFDVRYDPRWHTPSDSVRVERFFGGVLMSLSEAYYRFTRSNNIVNNSRSQLPIQTPANVFDNIEGGVGIFAGANVARKTRNPVR